MVSGLVFDQRNAPREFRFEGLRVGTAHATLPVVLRVQMKARNCWTTSSTLVIRILPHNVRWKPPSAVREVPVTKLASSEHRKAMARAISSGSPKRR